MEKKLVLVPNQKKKQCTVIISQKGWIQMYTSKDLKNCRKHATRTMIGAYFMVLAPYYYNPKFPCCNIIINFVAN